MVGSRVKIYHLLGAICEPNSGERPANDDRSDWFPFTNRAQFEVADFLYRRAEMSAGDINALLQIWGASLAIHNDNAPFPSHRAMYHVIDAIPYGEVPWKSFIVNYTGDLPSDSEKPRPTWMDEPQVIWYRDPLLILRSMIANPDFAREFDYTPYHEYINGVHQFHDFMSGDWAWKEAVCTISRIKLDESNIHLCRI